MQYVAALLLLLVLALDGLGGLIGRWLRNSQRHGRALQITRQTTRDKEL